MYFNCNHNLAVKVFKLLPQKWVKIKLQPSLLALSVCYLSGCGTQMAKQDTAEELPAPYADTTEVVKTPDRPFTSETLYALLVAEVAIDRRRFDVALGNYVQQANATRDAEVTARATHIARILKSKQSTLEMAQLWQELEPNSEDAQIIATAELIDANKLEEATALATQLLESGNDTAFDTIAIKATENDIELVRKLIKLYRPLTERYPEATSLWLGQSVLLLQNQELDEALSAARRALELDENNIRVAFQETRVLQQMGQQDLALEKLSKMVAKNPENVSLRAKYARVLARSNLGESRKPYASAAHYHLGMLHEKQGKQSLALYNYGAVEPGNNYLNAIVNATGILVKGGQLEEALLLVQGKRSDSPKNFSEGLFIIESDIQSSAGQIDAAEAILNQGLEENPKSTKLLYSRAMLHTQAGSIEETEKDLRAILSISPKNAAALNALGYTLADRTDRIDEAYEFIKQALTLTPEDPAVMDSMGWVEYRRGNYGVALELLTKAMSAMPDHEIAAHLGEVLWVTGQQDQAKSVWEKGLSLNPESTVIKKTLNRLNVKLD